jgi:hypothetical protein
MGHPIHEIVPENENSECLGHCENILNGTRSDASDPIHESEALRILSVSGMFNIV